MANPGEPKVHKNQNITETFEKDGSLTLDILLRMDGAKGYPFTTPALTVKNIQVNASGELVAKLSIANDPTGKVSGVPTIGAPAEVAEKTAPTIK